MAGARGGISPVRWKRTVSGSTVLLRAAMPVRDDYYRLCCEARNPAGGRAKAVRCFSLNVDFQYWKTSQDLVDIDASEDATIWRVGFEFTYNLFWPEDFQVGVGLGYSYTNITAENTAFIGEKVQDSHLMGSGLALVTNIHYYFTENFAIVPAVKFYENWFKFVNSKATGTCDLDPFLWQSYIFASIGLQYQF